MRTINFLGIMVIVLLLAVLYNSSRGNPYIYKNSNKHNIEIKRENFTPSTLTVNLGDEVIWRNMDYVLRHTVVTDDPVIRNSDVLLKGDEFKVIFDRLGEYVFYSSLYPQFQKGIVRVIPNGDPKKSRKYKKQNMLDVALNIYKIMLRTMKRGLIMIKNLPMDTIKNTLSIYKKFITRLGQFWRIIIGIPSDLFGIFF